MLCYIVVHNDSNTIYGVGCVYVFVYACLCAIRHCWLINPRRACAGGLRYLSCVCVCMSVRTPAPTSLVSTLKMRYIHVGVYLRLFSGFNSWIFDKTFRSGVMA